jgi:hypothetical protein
MKNVILLFLCVALLASARPVRAGVLEVSHAQTLSRIRLNGKGDLAAVLTYRPASTKFTIPDGWPVLEITEPTKLYLPDSIQTVAIESITYESKETTDQIKDHYIYNVIAYGLLALIVTAAAAEEDEKKDFGLRISAGAISGIGNSSHADVSIKTDFYFLSQTFRMTFGTSFILPSGGDIPITAVHGLGVEANIPVGANMILAGIAFHKAYLQHKINNLSGRKDWSYYVGYKWAMNRYHDIVFTTGWEFQPFSQSPADPALPLAEHPFFVRTAMEWYF